MKLKPVKAKGKGDEAASLFEAKVPNKDVVLVSALSPFSHRNYACLVPFVLEEGRSRTTVVYDTTSLVDLPSYLDMPVSSDQFVVIIESLLAAFNEIDRLGVDEDFLVFDPNRVYMNSVKGSVSFLLGEGARSKRKGKHVAFDVFWMLGSRPQPVSFEDRELMLAYVGGLEALGDRGSSSCRSYAQAFVDRFRGVVPEMGDSIKVPSQRFSREIFYDARQAAEQAEREVEGFAGEKLNSTMPKHVPLVLRLSSVSTGDTWNVDGDSYTIGSGTKADCRVKGNKWVSRLHARIVREGRKAYLEDLDSTNGTSLNGSKLKRGQRCELSDGDEFDLAGERFTVSIRSS